MNDENEVHGAFPLGLTDTHNDKLNALRWYYDFQYVAKFRRGLAFSARSDVRSVNEIFPLEQVNAAYDRMMSGKARFRVVLKME